MELSGFLSLGQIYLDSSTNDIKRPLYHGEGYEEQNIMPLFWLSCLVTCYNQWVWTPAKVNFDNKNGLRLNFNRPTSPATQTHAPV